MAVSNTKMEAFQTFLWCVFICHGLDSIDSSFNGQLIPNQSLLRNSDFFSLAIFWKILLHMLEQLHNTFIGKLRIQKLYPSASETKIKHQKRKNIISWQIECCYFSFHQHCVHAGNTDKPIFKLIKFLNSTIIAYSREF